MKFITLVLIFGMLSACTVSGDPWYVSEDIAIEDTGPPPDGGVDNPTWVDHVLPVFEAKCVPCHEGGATAFLTDSSVLENDPTGGFGCATDISMAACMLDLLEKQVMPLGCKDDKCVIGDELDLVKAWVADGAPLEGGEPAPPTWTADVLPVLKGYCASCHSTGNTAFITDDTILDNAAAGGFGCEVGISIPACILQLAEEKVMPLGCQDDKCVSDTDLTLLQDWVDGGAGL